MTPTGGKNLSATWSLLQHGDGQIAEITLESRSGRRGAVSERNADYKEALATILRLLGQHFWRLDDVQLTSAKALRQEADGKLRRVSPPDLIYPVHLETVTDPANLVSRLQRAMAAMFSERTEPGGGNRERRITLHASATAKTPDPRFLRGWLEHGVARTGSWLWITRGGAGDKVALKEPKGAEEELSFRHLSAMQLGDLVFHYSQRKNAVIAASRVVGSKLVSISNTSSGAAQMRPLSGYTMLAEPLPMNTPPGGALQAVPPAHAALLRSLLPPSPEGVAPYLINHYREADEHVSVRAALAHSADPALVERALAGHATTQNLLARAIRQAGLDPLSPGIDDPEFDLAWTSGEVVYIAEVKSVHDGNEESQLRLGLGQVLRYRHLLAAHWRRQVNPVLVLERAPSDATWEVTCRELDVLLIWPPFSVSKLGA